MYSCKTVKVMKEVEEVSEEIYSCDSCGKNITNGPFNNDKNYLRRQIGSRYPEGGHRRTEDFIFCISCWQQKVIPAVQEFIITGPSIMEINW